MVTYFCIKIGNTCYNVNSRFSPNIPYLLCNFNEYVRRGNFDLFCFVYIVLYQQCVHCIKKRFISVLKDITLFLSLKIGNYYRTPFILLNTPLSLVPISFKLESNISWIGLEKKTLISGWIHFISHLSFDEHSF